MLEMWWLSYVGDVVAQLCWRCGGSVMSNMWWLSDVGDTVA